ncbi:MAG TPA: dihydrodipicolinate synthase family protein [bacterium]|nr:dihydrodipicolinate synthase family protein [bacterium]
MPHVAPGVYNITATPLDPSGELDLAGLRRLVDFQVALGVTGLSILGNLGEVRYLTDAERDAVVDTTIAQVAGRAPVIVGMGFSGPQPRCGDGGAAGWRPGARGDRGPLSPRRRRHAAPHRRLR